MQCLQPFIGFWYLLQGNDGEILINRFQGSQAAPDTGSNLLPPFSWQFPNMLGQMCGLADFHVRDWPCSPQEGFVYKSSSGTETSLALCWR